MHKPFHICCKPRYRLIPKSVEVKGRASIILTDIARLPSLEVISTIRSFLRQCRRMLVFPSLCFPYVFVIKHFCLWKSDRLNKVYNMFSMFRAGCISIFPLYMYAYVFLYFYFCIFFGHLMARSFLTCKSPFYHRDMPFVCNRNVKSFL